MGNFKVSQCEKRKKCGENCEKEMKVEKAVKLKKVGRWVTLEKSKKWEKGKKLKVGRW